MGEVELIGWQRIARDVVQAELEVVLVTFEETVVEIGGEHVPVRGDQCGERGATDPLPAPISRQCQPGWAPKRRKRLIVCSSKSAPS